jgi:PmbA protein
MTLEDAKRYVLSRAQTRGIDAEVVGQRSRELSARSHGGRIEQLTQAVQDGLGVRVVVEGRTGYAYTEELTEAALEWMLDEAVENAGLQQATDGFLPQATSFGRADLLGDALAAPLEAKVAAALGFEGTLREDKRLKQVMLAGYTERETDVTVASTQGADGAFRRGVAGLGGSIVMQEGASLKQSWDIKWVTDLQHLDPGRTALEFTERTGRLLGARPLVTGRYPAYIEAKPFIQLLSFFWTMWSGKMVMEGKSPLAGRLGDRVASSLVTLIDDPTLLGGLNSRPFDAEGAPARPLALVELGVLRSFFHNSETARALGAAPTGHASRRYNGVLGVSPTNLVLQPGSGLPMERGVLVTEVAGVHAGANPISGEFSVQALGLWVEGGEVAYPVENFAVAGDFLTLLTEITGLGETLHWDLGMMGPGAFGAPSVGVAALSFAGA